MSHLILFVIMGLITEVLRMALLVGGLSPNGAGQLAYAFIGGSLYAQACLF